ncbi:MAG: 50S ribosomal protein L32 [Candidatus Saganbacteria bacterium]|nr:50S ribosomal protein L32 [Candidatus Saganbacteria bacterium]
MTVPKKRHSRSRQGKRRANWKLSQINLGKCPDCGAPILSHHACPSCGNYHGRSVL